MCKADDPTVATILINQQEIAKRLTNLEAKLTQLADTQAELQGQVAAMMAGGEDD